LNWRFHLRTADRCFIFRERSRQLSGGR
jgi:hypothetical protein